MFSVPRSWFFVPLLVAVGCGGQAQPLALASSDPEDKPTASRWAADDAGDELLRKRLSPPVHLPLADAPPVRKPASGQSSLDRRASQADLPAFEFRSSTVRADAHTAKTPLRPRPPAETAELPNADSLALPTTLELPAGPRANVLSVDAAKPTPLPPIIHRPVETGTKAADPAAEPARQALFSALAVLRETSAPFLRLTIPDPLENERTVRVRHEPPEPPHVDSKLDLPARPRLPVADPADKKK